MFSTLLVANRGEIACRIMRSAADLGIRTVAVYSDADERAAHVAAADVAVHIGPAPAVDSYLNGKAVLQAAHDQGAEAIHPGYGFLSESGSFARAVIDDGFTWVGPSPALLDALGDKDAARDRMAGAGMPIAAGARVTDERDAVALAARIGYPVMVKPTAGGGGIGMRIAHSEDELRSAISASGAQAQRFFGNPTLLIEQYLADARHVEIQVLGLGTPGTGDHQVVALGDRDCSVQRRWQKIVEETPSPGVDNALRKRMLDTAADAMRDVGYEGAGTVECLVSGGEFMFLEVNARLQVEHPVTELCTGIDLVAEQLRVAAGDEPGFDPSSVLTTGHAMEMRIYAEDSKRFLPSPGVITSLVEPSGPGIRIDSGYRQGDEVSRFYDPLIAKLSAHGEDRKAALQRLRDALGQYVVDGPRTNLAFLEELLANDRFVSGNYDTGLVARMRP